MKYLFFILTSFSAYSLGINDTMSLKVYDILKKNRISVNRGIADGLLKNDHLKINNETGYLARGIVIYTKETWSIIQLYRIRKNDTFSRDDHYILTSMRNNLISPHMKKYLFKDFSKTYEKFIPQKSSEPNIITKDLPRRTNKRELQEALKK